MRPQDGWNETETLDFQRNVIPLLISAQAYDLAEQVVAEVMEQRVGDVTTRLQMLEIASRSGKIDRMGDVLADLERIAGKTARWHFGNALLITANASPTSASLGTPQAAAAGSVPASQSTTNQLTDANNRKAQEHLAEAAVLRPDWNAVPALSGQLYDRAGDAESAIVKYSQAVDLGNRQPSMIRRLIGLLTQRERFGEADAMIRQMRSGNQPFSSDMARIASEVSVQMADLQRATRLAKQAAEESNAERDWLWLANLSELNNDVVTAEDAYQNALTAAPESTVTQLAWVGFLNRNARLGEAKDSLAEFATDVGDEQQQRLLAIAEGYSRIGEDAEARKQLQRIDSTSWKRSSSTKRCIACCRRCSRPATEWTSSPV